MPCELYEVPEKMPQPLPGLARVADIAGTILADHALTNEAYRDAFYRVMLDQPARFFNFLADFLTGRGS